MILDEIISHKRREVEESKQRFPEKRLIRALEEHAGAKDARSFSNAISGSRGTHIIAEIKKASPSLGVIREDFNPLKIAELYETGGAKALSILTETRYFEGRPSYLKTVRKVSSLPILRKDFILGSYQVYESAVPSADALLLIAMILSSEELMQLIQLAGKYQMDALVEVHSEEDLVKAIDAGAKIIGINNRNLSTLEVNVKAAERLLPKIPKGKIIVIESGIEKKEEIDYYKSLGVHAFLIGTSLMKSKDILSKLQGLI